MGTLPNLSTAYRQRFDVSSSGELLPGDGIPAASPLMVARLPRSMFDLNVISPTAKVDRLGRPTRRWNYELPPMEITSMLVKRYHIVGAAPTDNFPFKLRALGRIDVGKIKQGGGGLVSDDFKITP
jgi:hypothetical protein